MFNYIPSVIEPVISRNPSLIKNEQLIVWNLFSTFTWHPQAHYVPLLPNASLRNAASSDLTWSHLPTTPHQEPLSMCHEVVLLWNCCRNVFDTRFEPCSVRKVPRHAGRPCSTTSSEELHREECSTCRYDRLRMERQRLKRKREEGTLINKQRRPPCGGAEKLEKEAGVWSLAKKLLNRPICPKRQFFMFLNEYARE